MTNGSDIKGQKYILPVKILRTHVYKPLLNITHKHSNVEKDSMYLLNRIILPFISCQVIQCK